MGRIGNFFKKVWNGVKSFGRKVVQVLPKVIDTGKKIINNPITQTIGGTIADKAGFGPQFKTATTFAQNALNKADQVSQALKR
jgi:hypothetical protein